MKKTTRAATRSLLIWPALVALAVVIAIAVALHGGRATPTSAGSGPAGPASQSGQVTSTLSAGTDMQEHPSPAFTLSDQHGIPVSLASLRGHPVVLAFMDATCTTQCPILVQYLNYTAQFLTPQQVSQIDWVAISVNSNNTPTEATAFLTKNKATMPIHFLLGTQAQLQPLWKAYYVEVQPGRTDVAHTSGLYLLDQRGHEREWVDAGFDPKALAHDLSTLLKNSGSGG